MLTLATANAALARRDYAAALSALLEVWRAHRHPRIADLIDRVSTELTRERPPIAGKTIARRTATWLEVEKARDPADLGRLLATPWPGKWQDALPILEKLVAWPDDPRLAQALVSARAEMRYETWTAHNFWRPLFARLAQLDDVRILPRVAALALKEPNHYVRGSVSHGEQATIAALQRLGTPSLPRDVEAELLTLEAFFAGDAARERSSARGEAELLAAIYAAPDDVGLREVYGDFLGERGDPRGELIALQRARATGRATPAGERRERALIEKHGVAWAGALHEQFAPEGRVFEDGFFAGGQISGWWRSDADADAVLAQPAWSTIRVLHLGRAAGPPIERLLDHLPRLRVLYSANEELLTELVAGTERALSELGCLTTSEVPLDECPALPRLRALTIDSASPFIARLTKTALASRLEHLTLVGAPPPVEVVARLRRELPRLDALELRAFELVPSGFQLIINRDGAVRGAFHGSAPWRGVGDVVTSYLAALPADVKSIVIAPSRTFALKAAERARLDESLERLTALTHKELPWQPPPAKAMPAPARSGPRLELRVDGQALLSPEKAWPAVELVRDGLGLGFDSFRTGYNNTHRPLGDAPRKRIETWAANLRCDAISLYQDGADHELRLDRTSRHYELTTTRLEWPLGDRTPEDVIAVLETLLEMTRAESASVHVAGEAFHLEELRLGLNAPSGGWLMAFGARLIPFFPATALAQLAADPALAELTVKERPGGVLVRLTRAPDAIAPAARAALGRGLGVIAARRLDEKWGFNLAARTGERLGPVARELGLDPTLVTEGYGSLRFVGTGAASRHALALDRQQPFGEAPALSASLRVHADEYSFHCEPLGERARVTTLDELDRALTEIATRARACGAAFFADPEKKRR